MSIKILLNVWCIRQIPLITSALRFLNNTNNNNVIYNNIVSALTVFYLLPSVKLTID